MSGRRRVRRKRDLVTGPLPDLRKTWACLRNRWPSGVTRLPALLRTTAGGRVLLERPDSGADRCLGQMQAIFGQDEAARGRDLKERQRETTFIAGFLQQNSCLQSGKHSLAEVRLKCHGSRVDF